MRAVAGLIVIGLGTIIAPLDTAVNIGFPAIVGHFGLPLQMIQWVVICYVLTYASLTLVFGKLGDLFGYKRIFLAGLIISTIALSLCALAPTYAWLLFFRFLQGIGTALVLSCGLALATRLFSESVRGRIIGAYAMMFAIGTALGPSIGGVLVQAFDWNAVFWFRTPIALLAVAALWLLPPISAEDRQQPFDLIGAVLLAFSLTAMLLALNLSAPSQDAILWALALGIVAIIGFAGFILQEARFAEPLIRIDMFRDLDFATMNLANAIVNLVNFAILLLVPFYLVRVSDLSVAEGGMVLAIGSFGAIVASPIAGRMIERVRPRPIALAGALLVAVGLWFVSEWHATTGAVEMVAALFLAGIGIGLFQVTYMDIVTGTLSRGDRGVAGSLTMVTRTIGNVTGATGLTLIFHQFELAAAEEAAAAQESFLLAFSRTFQVASGCLVGFLALTLLRPSAWFAAKTVDPVHD